MMKIQRLATIVTTSILITACGGGEKSTTIPNGNGGTTTVTQGGAGNGKATITKDLVATSKCKTTVVKGRDADTTVSEYVGASGSIETPCQGSDEYKLKSGVTNLNLNSMVIQEFWYCKDIKGKAIFSWVISYDLGKGKSSASYTSDGQGEYIKCTGTFASPLPKTVSSPYDIDNLIDYWEDNSFENNNCTIATGQGGGSNSLSCESDWTTGKNITFVDDAGGVHKTTRKKNWIIKKHE